MKKSTLLIVILVISFITSIVMILLSGKKLEKIIVSYSTKEVKRIANVILNDVIILDDVFDKNFYNIIRDSEGNISLIDFDSNVTNDILKKINSKALKKIKELEKGNSKHLELSDSLKGTRLTYLDNGIVCDIPLGVLLNNSLLINFTTSIPIKFSFIGTVTSNMFTNVKEYGFNNALIEIGVEVTIKEQVTMPHSTETVKVTTKINLATQVIQGQVPLYYNGAFTTSSNTFSTKTP